jgi:hypothetical protein
MSVLMTMVAPGDPAAIERIAKEEPDRMAKILDHAKSCGLIAHRFYASEGKCMVIDEWPDPESFQKFFWEMESEIGPMMQAALTAEPEVTFWTKMDTGDDVGWGA